MSSKLLLRTALQYLICSISGFFVINFLDSVLYQIFFFSSLLIWLMQNKNLMMLELKMEENRTKDCKIILKEVKKGRGLASIRRGKVEI